VFGSNFFYVRAKCKIKPHPRPQTGHVDLCHIIAIFLALYIYFKDGLKSMASESRSPLLLDGESVKITRCRRCLALRSSI